MTTLFVTHAQVAVFNPDLESPFNDWTEQHVRQGFSWRPGSVSFRTLSADGDLEVTSVVGERPVAPEARRAIVVPFSCTGSKVEVSTIADSAGVDLPRGEYALRFEHWTDAGGMHCRLVFTPSENVKACVLTADEALQPQEPLLMVATPA
jgi:hypothetical protein